MSIEEMFPVEDWQQEVANGDTKLGLEEWRKHRAGSKRICECGNCDWKGPEDKLRCDLGGIEDLFERIDPGSIVPSGECPECGALAYLFGAN